MDTLKTPTEHILPDLPYSFDALVPFISAETLKYHYGRHHKGYVEKLNKLVVDTRYASLTLDALLLEAEGAMYNNAAQVWNHGFYWKCMTPVPSHGPSASMLEAIQHYFGSEEKLFDSFKQAATSNFGSGWTWLAFNASDGIIIQNTHDADTPQRHGDIPLLTCDVWEHAYYLDYRNERNSYIDAFWDLVNWRFVESNFQAALEDVVTPDNSAA